jgi:hypothetical protein
MGVGVRATVNADATLDRYNVTLNMSSQLYDLATFGDSFSSLTDRKPFKQRVADNVSGEFVVNGSVNTTVERHDDRVSLTVALTDARPKPDGNVTLERRDGRIVFRDEIFNRSSGDPTEIFGGLTGSDDGEDDSEFSFDEGPDPVRTDEVAVTGGANVFAAGRRVPPNVSGGGGVLPSRVDVAGADNVTFDGGYGADLKRGPPFAVTDAQGAEGVAADVASMGGIAGIVHEERTFFVAGVFLGPGGPPATAPSRLRFPRETELGETEVVLSPAVGQTFYVGDGTTTGYEDVRAVVPEGATRLYLGMVEARNGRPGGYGDNTGSVDLEVEQYGPTNGSVEEDAEPEIDLGDESLGDGNGSSLFGDSSLSGLSGLSEPSVTLRYRLEMPGTILNSSADTVDGSVARWNRTVSGESLRHGGNASFVVRAESRTGDGSPLPGFGSAAATVALLATIAAAAVRRR